jgi:hypothetical protein
MQTHIDGREEDFTTVVAYGLKSPEEVEQLGREVLQAAAEWRAEIEARNPPGPPIYKVHNFINSYGRPQTIATWVERPWGLAVLGKGTSPIFLVKERKSQFGPEFEGWMVSLQLKNGELLWKCRFENTSTVGPRDLIQILPYSLPDTPTSGDIELARKQARESATDSAEEKRRA